MKLRKTEANIAMVCQDLKMRKLTNPQRILLNIVEIQMKQYGFISDSRWGRLKEVWINGMD